MFLARRRIRHWLGALGPWLAGPAPDMDAINTAIDEAAEYYRA